MQVQLNPNSKTFMCFIGDPKKDKDQIVAFTSDDPGPKTINLETLTDSEKRQIIYNLQRGTLLVDDKNALFNTIKTEKINPKFTPVTQSTVPQSDLALPDVVTKKIKMFLNQHHATIKRKLFELSAHDARIGIQLERVGRGRKSVLEMLEKYAATKLNKQKNTPLFTGGDVLADSLVIQNEQLSTQVGDVVESDTEEVILIPPGQDI